jgi:hypothetical protein
MPNWLHISWGRNAMDMRMVMQVLAPGVKHGNDADRRPEVLRVGRHPAQRLGRRPEQDGVDHGLVLEGYLCSRPRQGKDDMEVGHRQQFGLPGGEPRAKFSRFFGRSTA